MVSVVAGSGAGLGNTSKEVVGGAGTWGQAELGRAAERVSVNAIGGNLVVQNRDEFLVGVGEDLGLLRTYNSQGAWDGDNADNWRIGLYRRVAGLTGTANTAGSTIKRIDADGFESTYTYNGSSYTGKDGAGAYDSLSYNATTKVWTWTDGDTGSTETYNETSAGSGLFRLVQITDAEGHSLRLSYDAAGLISTVASWKAGGSAADETVTLTYDNATNKRLTQVSTTYKNEAGATVSRTRVRYEYDANGRLQYVRTDLSPEDNSIADGRAYWVRYGYDAAGRVNSITQTDGSALTIEYDASGRVSRFTDALGRVTTLGYDTTNRKTTITDALSQATVMTYDTSNRLTEVAGAALGGTAFKHAFAYDADGNLTGSTNARGEQTVFAYSANGALTRRTDAAGNVLERSYDSANRLTAETVYSVPDPDGAAGAALPSGAQTTRYVYDTTGGKWRLRFSMSPEGRVTQYTYNTLGQRSAATTYTNNLYSAGSNPTLAELTTWAGALSAADRALAEQRDYAYDLRGQLVSVKEYASATVSGSTVTYTTPSEQRYVYDAFGRLLQTIDATGNSTVFAYDGLNRLTLARDAGNASTIYAYDDAGNRSTVTLANGQYSISQYNAAGQLVTSTAYNPAGAGLGATRYFYDGLDRLRMAEDPTGTRRWMFYDPAGRKVADVDALGQVTEYAYDGAGRLVQSIGYANVLSAATLATLTDVGGNPVTTKTVADVRPAADAAKDRLTTRYYDGAGRLVGVQDSAGYLTETRYDGASRVLGTTAWANAGSVTRVDTSTGSTLATPPALVRPAANAAADRVTRNFYGNDGLLLAALDAEGYLVEWEYDAAGRKVAQTRYANATPVAERAAGTLAALRPARHAQDQRSISLYDNQGRLAAELDAEGYLTEFQYDLADRLATTTRWRNTALRTVTVDGTGVVSYQAATGLTPTALRPAAGGSEATTRSYTVLGALDTETQASGLVIKNVYDSLGRLATSTRAYGSTEARGSGIGYDAWGRVQTETDGRGGTLTHAYDNAGRRISTTDARSNTTVFYYDAAGRLVYSILKTSLGGEVRESRYNAFGEAETRLAYTNRLAVADTTPLTGGLVNATLAGKVNALTNTGLDAKSVASFTRRGQIQQAIDALGAKADYSYDAFGQLTQSLADLGDGRRLRTDLAYDRRGLQLSSTADPTALNVRTSTEYDAFGRVTARVDARGLRSTIAYLRNDGAVDSGRKVTLTDPLNAARTTVYDAFDRTIAQTDALGNTVRFVHDVTSRRVTMTSAEGIVSVTESNRHGQLYKLTDGAGATTTYAYDGNGNLLSITDALGKVSSKTYDAANNQLTSTDPSGNLVQYSYDSANRVLTRRLDPAGLNLTTSYAYDGQGRAVTLTDAAGTVTSYVFDAKGQLKDTIVDDVTGGLKLKTSSTFDAQGRTLTVTEGAGTSAARTVEYRYDMLGRRTHEIVDPAGLALTTTFQYDAAGNVVLKRDALANATRFVYDNAGRLQYSIDATGGVTERSYDAEGRLTGVKAYARTVAGAATLADAQIRTAVAALTDTRDQLTQYVYDRDGRQIVVADAEGGVTRSQYDGAGRVTVRTRYATVQTGAWTAARVPVLDAAKDQTTYTVYDSIGRARYSIDALDYVSETVYDNAGRVVASKRFANTITRPATLNEANLASALSTRLDAVNDRVEYYAYDAAGRQRFKVDAEGYVTEHQLDAVGRVTATLRHAAKLSYGSAPTLATLTAATRTLTTFDADLAGFGGAAAIWEAGKAKLISQPDAGGSWAGLQSPRSLPTGSSFKFDLTPNHLQYSLHAGVEGSAGRYARIVALLQPDGRVLAQTYDPQGNARYTDLGAYTVGTTYTVEVTTSDTAATLYFYAKGTPREAGYVFRSVADFGWTAVNLRFYAQRYPSLTSTTTAFVDNVEERTATIASNVYDKAGRLKIAADAEGVRTQYNYDAAGRVVEKLTAVGTAEEISTRYTYDADGRVLEETRGYGKPETATTRYRYDANGRLIAKIDPRGVAEAAAGGLTVAQQNAILDSYTTRYAYDAAGQRTSVTDPLGGVTTTAYDSFGNAVKVTDARGNSGYFGFDRANRNTLYVDPEGFVVANRYDAFGNKTGSTQHANRAVGTWSATALPAIVATAPGSGPYVLTDAARDAAVAFAYDRLNRLTQRTDAENVFGTSTKAYETWGYDSFGNKTSYRNKVGGVYGYQYDRRGLLTRETLPVTTKTAANATIAVVNSYAYDARGNRTRATEAEGAAEQRITTYLYDALDRLVQTSGQALTTYRVGVGFQSGVVPVTTSSYDARGNLVAQTDANGNRTAWYYDALNRKVGEVNAGGTLSVWQYDRAGNATSQRVYADPVALPAGATLPAPVNAANVRETLFSYDANNRQIESRIVGLLLGRYDDAAGQYRAGAPYGLDKVVITKKYDAVGNLIKLTDGNGGVAYTFYDRAGQKILEVDPEGYGVAWVHGVNGTTTRETRFARRHGSAINETSNATTLISSWPVDAADRITDFSYDRDFRLISETRLNVAYGSVDGTSGALTETSGSAVRSYAYDGLDNKIRETDANGRQSDWSYDVAGRRTREQLPGFTDFEGASVRATTDYEYNGLNAVLRVVRRGKDNAVETDDEIMRYTYGVGGRLVSQTDAKDQVTQLDYDAAGNLTLRRYDRRDADNVVTNEGSVHAYDALNREVSRQSVTSPTGTAQYGDKVETRYNAYGEVTGRRTNGGNAAGEWQEYAEYNALGRVAKSNSGGGITKAYLYDANGNATLTIESAGANLRPLTTDQILARSDVYKTITLYDRRNQSTSVIQPEMVAARDLADVRQLVAQQVTLAPGGGGLITNVGTILSTQPTGSTQAPVLTDAQRFQNISSAVTWNVNGYTDSEGGYVTTGATISNVRVNLSVPSIGQYVGAWTFMRVRIDYRLTGATAATGTRDIVVTDRNATSATVNLGLNTGTGNINFSYTVTVSFGYAAAPEVNVGSAQFGAPLAWTSNVQVPDGEGGYTSVVQQNFAAAGAFNGSFKTSDLGAVASAAPGAFFSVWQDKVAGDLVSSTVSWNPSSSDAEAGYNQVTINGVTVGLPVSSFNQTFGNFVRVVVYVDYDLSGDAYGTRTVQATITSPTATSVYVPINYTTSSGDKTFSHNVRVAYYWSTGGKEIQLASPGTQTATIAYLTARQVSDGEGGYTTVYDQNFAAAGAFNRSFYADTSNKTFFSGGSELLNANEAYLYYRTSTTGPYTGIVVPRAGTLLSDTATNPGNPAQGIFYVWNSWLPAGIVDYKLVAMTGGALTGSFRGSAIGSTVGLTSENRSQVGEIFFDSYPAIHFFDQQTPRLAIQYRRTGSTTAWTQVEVGAYETGGWFSWAWQAAGLSGAYDMRVLRMNSAGTVTSRMFTQVNLSATPSATALVPYAEAKLLLTGQPDNANTLTFRYRVAGSTGAFTSTSFTKVATGSFERDFQNDNLLPVVTAASSYDYEYQYDAYDAGGQVVNGATGTFRVTPNTKSFLSHNSTRLPTIVPFTVDDAAALYMDIRYRPAGSTGAYTTVPRLSRASAAVQFRWDASAITPASGSANYEYEYRLYNSSGSAVLNPLGQAIVVLGTVTVGTAPTQAASTGWVITGVESTTNVIRRRQSYNAFGEVDSETDGRNNTTNLFYNTLGALVRRQDPTTDITGENGVTTRARPETRWIYDRTGKAVATRDANGFVTAQQWNDGLAQAVVAKEFHADGGKPVNAYDVFGNLRIATDAEGRQTRYTYDKNNQLTRLDRPTRATGQYLAGQAAWETYEYDQLGNRIATSNVLGRARSYFDREGRVSKTTSIEGRSTTYAYTYYTSIGGAGGVQVGGWQKVTTAIGGKVSYENKDVFGRMTWRRDFGSHDYSYAYNHAGWLTAQTSTQGGAPQQNLSYEYYNNGYLKRQTDNVYFLQSDFTYDANGNRVFEGYKRTGGAGNEVFANSFATYDELNRVKTVTDPKYEIRYKYDAVGNRRNVYSYYNDGLDGNKQVQDYWYLYDSMNRFTVTMGQLSGGVISRGTTGKLISYNKASERMSSEYYDATSTKTYRERYTYTSDGFLQDMFLSTWNGTAFVEQTQAASSRSTDLVGRVLAFAQRDSSNALITNLARTFDRDNRQTQEVDYTKVYNSAYKTDTYAYNADGTLATISTSNVATTLTRSYTYQWWDSAKQTEIKLQAANQSAPGWAPGTSKLTYDLNGNLFRATDVAGKRTIQYVTDGDGQILFRQELAARQGVASDWNATTLEVVAGDVARKRNYYYLNGHRIGDVNNEGAAANGLDYAEALAQARAASNDEKNKKFTPTAYANFDENYQPINDAYPGTAPTDYTVANGDSLQSIAARIWGDRALWYLIADANGLSGAERLTEGMRLVIPNKVANLHNNAGTFKVYDAGEAIGDVSPTLPEPPPPPKGGCGGLGQIIMIAIAVVVTVWTAGAASAAIGAALGATAGSVAAGVAAVAGAAIGGAAGSLASQGFAVAVGMQDSINWRAVGQSALGGAITAGVGLTGFGDTFAKAVGSSAGSWVAAGANSAMSTGLRLAMSGDWSWRQVVGSAVGGAIGGAAGAGGGSAADVLASIGGRFVGGWLNTRISQRRADPRGAWANALGSALGDTFNTEFDVARSGWETGVKWGAALASVLRPVASPSFTSSATVGGGSDRAPRSSTSVGGAGDLEQASHSVLTEQAQREFAETESAGIRPVAASASSASEARQIALRNAARLKDYGLGIFELSEQIKASDPQANDSLVRSYLAGDPTLHRWARTEPGSIPEFASMPEAQEYVRSRLLGTVANIDQAIGDIGSLLGTSGGHIYDNRARFPGAYVLAKGVTEEDIASLGRPSTLGSIASVLFPVLGPLGQLAVNHNDRVIAKTLFDVGVLDKSTFDVIDRGIDSSVKSNQIALALGVGLGAVAVAAPRLWVAVEGRLVSREIDSAATRAVDRLIADKAAGTVFKNGGAEGTRAHIYFQEEMLKLNERLIERGSRYRVEPEKFLDRLTGLEAAYPRAKNSWGLDAFVTRDAIPWRGFDLKTGELWTLREQALREQLFRVPIRQIYRDRTL